LLSLYTYL